MKYFYLVKNFVDNAFSKLGRNDSTKHFERTVYWLLELKPDADEAMQIAAYAHDTERAFRKETDDDLKGVSYKDKFFTEYHPKKGAEIIEKLLKENEAPSAMIEKVNRLISSHEIGGDEDQNLIKDADSISFLEDQQKIDWFIQRGKKRGMEAIKEKFDWQFERITSQKAKEIARPLYEAAIKKLNKK